MKPVKDFFIITQDLKKVVHCQYHQEGMLTSAGHRLKEYKLTVNDSKKTHIVLWDNLSYLIKTKQHIILK